MIEQWFKYPSGEICRIRPTTPDGTGRPRVEMRYSNGDWAYVWPETAKGLLASAKPCDPVPGMLS